MIVVLNGGGFSSNNAVIHIYAVSGSTITLKKDGVIVATLAASKGHTNSVSNVLGTFADWYYSVGASNYGSWTITAEKDSASASKTITVDSIKQYDVELLYAVYIVKNGVVQSGFTRNNSGGTVNIGADYIDLHSNAASNTYATMYFTPNVDVTKYNSLVLDARVRGYYASGHTPAVGILNNTASGSNYSTFIAAKMLLSSGTGTLQAKQTYTLSISNISGSRRIGFQEAGTSYSNYAGDIYCYNLYLKT